MKNLIYTSKYKSFKISKYLRFGKWNKNNKYIFLTATFAFFTNLIYGYTFNDNLNEIKFFQIFDD